jgi:hypothetical protein
VTRSTLLALAALALLAAPARAQGVLFDFDSAPLGSPLPLDLTVGGITAHFSATGQGYSIQRADALGFTPQGFAGLCIYPSSVFLADLLVSFSRPLQDFSILYAPEEYACDSSARMRVTGYLAGSFVATNTTTAPNPGTWPTGVLTLTAPQGFDSVVIHYDAPPPTGGDWGPIFMADNMTVTPLPGLSASDVTVTEIDGPGRQATVTLSLSAASSGSVTVQYATADGTALASSDYTSRSGSLTFAPGATSQQVSVPILGDTVPEPTETLQFLLSSPVGATLTGSAATIRIRDDDPTAADFHGDGTADVVVYRGGAWQPFDYATGSAGTGVFTGQPGAGCIPAPLDHDGDGRLEFSQLCLDHWYFYDAAGSLLNVIPTGGSGSDLPVPADYDGDGKDDVVLYRLGSWMAFDYTNGAFAGGVWTGHPPHFTGGAPVPYPADFDGDGKADFSIYAGGPWHFYNPDGSYKAGIWTGSISGDIPVAGDYDGDGADEVVVWRAGAWLWFDRATGLYDAARSVFTGAPPHWTGGVSLPGPLDVDGDGRLEYAVYSGGPWHFYQQGGAYDRGVWCGAVAGDLPISRRGLP